MKNSTTIYLVNPGPRPAYYKIADHLWGEGANIDSDGDSKNPDDTAWTELSIILRSETRQQVDVDLVAREPLVFEISSTNRELAMKAAAFLQLVSGGSIAERWPNA